MQLTPGTSINRGDQVTRQTLYNIVALATGGTVQVSDLDSGTLSVVSQSLPPTTLTPGILWWDQTDQLMKVWTDVLDNTGVSCWLAIGPDRFDCAVCAGEHIPWGAAVQLMGRGRFVQLPPSPMQLFQSGYSLSRWEAIKVMGFNNHTWSGISCPTAASGTWFSCAVDGLVWSWHPANALFGATWQSSQGASSDGLISGATGFTGDSNGTNVRGGLIGYTSGDVTINRGPYVTRALTAGAKEYAPWLRQIFVGPKLMRDA